MANMKKHRITSKNKMVVVHNGRESVGSVGSVRRNYKTYISSPLREQDYQ